MSPRPRIGLIVPPAGGGVPPECTDLYGADADFIVADAALRSLDLAGYGEAETRLPALARQLVDRGAEAVVLMGTSMSFFQGRGHAEQLSQILADASGCPATTMSAAIVGAIRATGARKVALATAYVEEVNAALISFLRAYGIEASAVVTLDIRDVGAIRNVTSDEIVELGRLALSDAPEAEALFISCGGLNTLEATNLLEAQFHRPVVSSAVAGAWAAASMAGVAPGKFGCGDFLQLGARLPSDLISVPQHRQRQDQQANQ